MDTSQPSVLEIPSCLHGTLSAVMQKAREEGQRCAEQYLQDGSLPAPQQMLKVPPHEVIILHEVVDFHRERPAWRLHMLGKITAGLTQALSWRNSFQMYDMYEALVRETPWGALYYATGRVAPYDVACYALRFKAVLRFWEPLESVRYLFSSPGAQLSLEELMLDSCGWALTAWCPEGGASFRVRLERAAERMAQATREDCIEAILRQVPHTLPFAGQLKHPGVVANLELWRKHLASLAPEDFDRLSSALPSGVLECLYAWDEQLAT